MPDLNIALLQSELHWEDPTANRDQFATQLTELKSSTDLAVLPEMFTTGFSMDAEKVAEDGASDTVAWMQDISRTQDMALCGSLAVRDGNQIFNRLLFTTPDGTVSQYDKKHLFRISGEDKHYSAGRDKLVVEWRDWRICPMICYDLRFPVWSRNQNDYDLLLFVANWPAKRRMHWRQLLIARAIENQAYCVGLNRVGSDGNGLAYSGDSLVIAGDGELLLDAKDEAGVFTAQLGYEAMTNYRSKFPCHRDADDFTLAP